MANKHNLKRNRIKQPVERTLVQKGGRKVITNPVTGEVEVKHTPDIYSQGKPSGSTVKYGQPNKPENMAPKGAKK